MTLQELEKQDKQERRAEYERKIAKAREMEDEAAGYAWESHRTEDDSERKRLADIANTEYHRASLLREEAHNLL